MSTIKSAPTPLVSTAGVGAAVRSRPRIDWKLISKALDYYTSIGYSYIEAPWIVSEKALAVTLPPGKTGLRTQDGPLVGSAEQSFIQLMLDGQLPPASYVAATPCFRDDEIDDLHQRTFFKVELIEVLDADERSDMALLRVLNDAMDFFQQAAPSGSLLYPETKIGFDVELGGVEIGSYGYRQHGKHRWIYGTGLAEPRFSIARSRHLFKNRS